MDSAIGRDWVIFKSHERHFTARYFRNALGGGRPVNEWEFRIKTIGRAWQVNEWELRIKTIGRACVLSDSLSHILNGKNVWRDKGSRDIFRHFYGAALVCSIRFGIFYNYILNAVILRRNKNIARAFPTRVSVTYQLLMIIK